MLQYDKWQPRQGWWCLYSETYKKQTRYIIRHWISSLLIIKFEVRVPRTRSDEIGETKFDKTLVVFFFLQVTRRVKIQGPEWKTKTEREKSLKRIGDNDIVNVRL
jgi:hypothetical protein